MSPLRSVGTFIVVGLSLVGLPACSSVLMNTPVSKTAEGWSVTLSQAKVGPNEFIGEGGVRLTSDEGEDMVWTTVTVKNEGGQEQTFVYDTCLLEGGGQVRRPLTVGRPPEAETEVAAAVDRSEAYTAGQARLRQLIYSFPKDVRPTLLKCGAILLPIKGAK